jgi:integrase/recombinase XerD
MLDIYRRHLKRCAHREMGRNYRKCDCPVWVDGHMDGARIHESLGTTDKQKAQQIVREWEANGGRAVLRNSDQPLTVRQAWLLFLADLEARKLQPSTIRKYRLLQRQMQEFALSNNLPFLIEFDVDRVSQFRSGWKDGALSSSKKLERLRAFFRFAQKRKWALENPASELRAPKVATKPTMPFTLEEMQRILGAVDLYIEGTSANGQDNARRIRALVLILRYTGMRISDAVGLSTDRIEGNRLFLYTQKTSVPVHTVLPDFVLSALESTPRCNDKYFFWSGNGKLDSIVRSWQTRLRRLFRLAKIKGHAHRFRDTFAVELLLAGVPIERVSILLGHQSVRVTEKHYNPWVRSRQEQLEADLERAWGRDPIVLLESKVTRQLRGETQVLN